MKKLKIIVPLLLLPLVLSGCNNGTSLSDMSIAQGVAIDMENGKTKLSVQYLDLAKGIGTTDNLGDNITSVTSGTADNISKAVSITSANLSSPIFFGQDKVIVFGEDYAKESISSGIDYVLRAVDSRVDVLVAMSETTGEDVIKSSENNAKVPAGTIYDMLKTGQRSGLSYAASVSDVLNLANSKTSDMFLPVLSTKDNKTRLAGIGIFSKGKYVATLNDSETLGFILINNKVENATLVVDDEKLGKVGVEIKDIKTKNIGYYYDNSINFDTRIKLDITLNDTEKGIATKVTKTDIKRIEGLVNKRIEGICKSTVNTCFSNKSDPFSLGKMLSKYSYSYYKKFKSNWREQLPNVKYRVKCYSKMEMVSDNSTGE